MNHEHDFLHALAASFDDTHLRLVYADWLEERGDARAEFLRLDVQLETLPADASSIAPIRQRLDELRQQISPSWRSLIGDHYAKVDDSAVLDRSPDAVAEKLGRPARYVDDEGYERNLIAVADNPLSGALAYVECRSQQRGAFHDVNYHLHVCDGSGRSVVWEVVTYNPYFGCEPYFFEWYGNEIVFIYEEKHRTYVCRFGLNSPAEYRALGYDWTLRGRQIGHRGYKATSVARLALPSLRELPPLTPEQAEAWGLFPLE